MAASGASWPVAACLIYGTIVTSKRKHAQAKKYLDEHARHEKYLRQCGVCQRIGYDEEKLQERNEALYRKQIQSFYEPIVLNAAGRCEECAARAN